MAPLWILIQHFDCREQLPPQRLIPVSALLDLYAAKQLSRSTLVAGLERNTAAQLGQMVYVPAPFLRPLEYVLELIEASPTLYRPITSEDLTAGLPPADWCLPLHMELAMNDGGEMKLERPPKGLPLQQFNGTEAAANAALAASPYW